MDKFKIKRKSKKKKKRGIASVNEKRPRNSANEALPAWHL